MRTVMATRYVTPLREGGSLPAIVEADDEGMYVLKFRGAGQGHKALIAEFVAGRSLVPPACHYQRLSLWSSKPGSRCCTAYGGDDRRM